MPNYYDFVLVLDRVLSDEEIDAVSHFFEGDASVTTHSDKHYSDVEVCWEGTTEQGAITAASEVLIEAVPGIKIVRVEPVEDVPGYDNT